jgi:epoxyqueuosine reductase
LQDPLENSSSIRQKALELGFLQAGMARADHLAEDAARLREWLDRGYQGSMGYMENHFEKRVDPRKLVEGARSIVVVLQNYFTAESQLDKAAPRISKYALGKDYHRVMRKKLRNLYAFMAEHLGAQPDRPMKDYCGDCTRCVDACPTQAILPGKVVDASRCISYLTIENRADKLPETFKGKMQNWAFGCDICQEVCPWNNNAHPHAEPWLTPRPGLLEMSRTDWLALDEAKFDRLFEGSAVRRTGYRGLRRNIGFL